MASFALASARMMRAEGVRIAGWIPVNEISFWAWAGGDEGHFEPHLNEAGRALKRQLVRAHLQVVRVLRDHIEDVVVRREDDDVAERAHDVHEAMLVLERIRAQQSLRVLRAEAERARPVVDREHADACAPERAISAVSWPVPQPTSRIRSPACAASSPSSSFPYSQTKEWLD